MSIISNKQNVTVVVAPSPSQLSWVSQRGNAHYCFNLAGGQYGQLLDCGFDEPKVGSGAQFSYFVVDGFAVRAEKVKSHILVSPKYTLITTLQVHLQQM